MMMDEEQSSLRGKKRDSLRDFDDVLPPGMTHVMKYSIEKSTSSALSSSSSSRRGSSTSNRKFDSKSDDTIALENPLRFQKYIQSSSFGSSQEEPYSSNSRHHLYISPSISEMVDSVESTKNTARKVDIFHLTPSLSVTEASANWRSIDEDAEVDDYHSSDNMNVHQRHDNPLLSSKSRHRKDDSTDTNDDFMSKVVLI
jgi:hypothetical protein